MSTFKLNSQQLKYAYFLYRRELIKSKRRLRSATSTSLSEIKEDFSNLFQRTETPFKVKSALFFKDLVGSGLWVFYSYMLYLRSISNLKGHRYDFLDDPTHKQIIDCVKNSKAVKNPYIDQSDIFKSVFEELTYLNKNESKESVFKAPSKPVHIYLISGVFNELFKTAAFERGAQYLKKKYNIDYTVGVVDGTKSSEHNSKLIFQQLKSMGKDKKIWIVAFSKGALDSLHFLVNYPHFSRENIAGISTVASPLKGSQHTEKRFVRVLELLQDYSEGPLHQHLKKNKNIFLTEISRSLSEKYQDEWFKNNYRSLPQSIFYSSIGFHSRFHQSHVWMMFAKVIFPSRNLNDGIVDLDRTSFPHYFSSYDFGSLPGHHLSGTRSSSFNQEAFLEAHLVCLEYLQGLKANSQG